MNLRSVFAALLLIAPAVLPLLATTGVRAESVALLVPVGFLFAGAAATLAVMTDLSFVFWLAVVVVAVDVVAGWELVRRRRAGRPMFGVSRRWGDWAPGLAAVMVSAYGLTELGSQGPDPDTLSIWFLHARLLDSGAISYASAMHSASSSFSHLEYPLVVPGGVNELWSAAGGRDYHLAQVMITLLGMSLLVLVCSLIGRVARGAAQVYVGVVISILFAAAAFGVIGRYATDGYADMSVALAALAGAIALLLLPRSSTMTAVGVTCLWIAGLTKPEGLFAAAAIALLVAIRRLVEERRQRRLALPGAILRSGSSFVLLVVPGLVWVLYTAVAYTAPVYYGQIPPDDLSVMHRAGLAWSALRDRIWFIGWLALIIVIAAWAWRRSRRRRRLGSVAWLGSVAVLYVLGLVVRYATGPYDVRWWLATSAERVTMLPRLLLLTELAIVTALALAELPALAAGHARDAMGSRAGSSRSPRGTTRYQS